jgi:tRNA U55 pseudouridine synthase TruB
MIFVVMKVRQATSPRVQAWLRAVINKKKALSGTG